MAELLGVLQATQVVVFAGLGAAGLRYWRRHRDEASVWLASAFGILAVVVVAGELVTRLPETWATVAQTGLVALLVVFPYALFRFTGPFVGSGRGVVGWLAVGSTVVLVAWSLALGEVPEAGEGGSAFAVFIVAVLAHWLMWSGVAAARLWRAGRDQPWIARRRLRLLATGMIALSAALVIAGVGSTSSAPAVNVATALFALVSAPLFYLGFDPPSALRAVWRRSADEALYAAQLGLVGATRAGEAADAVMPFAEKVLGASGLVLVDAEGEVVLAEGVREDDDMVAALRTGGEPGADTAAVPVRDGWLAVRGASVIPVFGEDEIELLESLGVFVGIVLDRLELFASERRALREVERARAELEVSHDELEARRAQLVAANAELEERASELERSNAELEQFAHVASHDLQEPLRKVASYCQLLQRRYGDQLDGDAEDFIEFAVDGAQRMQELIDDLLTYSRIGRSGRELESVELRAVFDRVITNLSLAIEDAGADVTAGELPNVVGDARELTQLFQNLISNALKFAGDAQPRVRMEAQMQPGGDMVEVTVADNGIGIEPEYRERIFGVFQRLHARRDYAGTGIGLAICARIADHHGGDIAVTSTPGRGSTFHVTLPSAREADRVTREPVGSSLT